MLGSNLDSWYRETMLDHCALAETSDEMHTDKPFAETDEMHTDMSLSTCDLWFIHSSSTCFAVMIFLHVLHLWFYISEFNESIEINSVCICSQKIQMRNSTYSLKVFNIIFLEDFSMLFMLPILLTFDVHKGDCSHV